MQRVEPTLDRARAPHHPGRHRPQPLEIARSKLLQLEQIANQSPCGFPDDHPIRLGNSLEAGGQVRRFTHDRALLRTLRPDQVADDNQPGCDADTCL